MDKVKLALLLVSIAITAGPILTVLFTYYSNPIRLVVTPEIEKFIKQFVEKRPSVAFVGWELVDSTVRLRFTVSNPWDIDITIKEFSASIECDADNFVLGSVTLEDQEIRKESNSTITMNLKWTTAGINHIASNHLGQASVPANLADVKTEVFGFVFTLEQKIPFPIPLPTLPGGQ
jgi:LEA14-like dessication related protein